MKYDQDYYEHKKKYKKPKVVKKSENFFKKCEKSTAEQFNKIKKYGY